MNSKNSILLVDPEFDPATATSCSLLIKVTADNYSYAIINKANEKLVALYDQQECPEPMKDLANRLDTDNYLSIPFSAVKAAVYTQNSIVIPNDIFEDANLGHYAKFFLLEQSEQLYKQPAESFGFTSIFTLASDAEEKLKASFQECTFFDHAAPLLSIAKQHADSTLLLDFTVGFFNATYTSNGKLIFQHCYEIGNEEEFNYYLLLMIKQLAINTPETRVLLSGIIHNEDKRFAILKKYFNTIVFNMPEPAKMNIEILDDMPDHYYTTLLAIDLCE